MALRPRYAGYGGDAVGGYGDGAPAAAAPAPVVPDPSPGLFDPEDLPPVSGVQRETKETEEAFYARRVLTLIDRNRDTYLEWEFDHSEKTRDSWLAWISKQWHKFQPMEWLHEAVAPEYTYTIDKAVTRNVAAAVAASRANAIRTPQHRFRTTFRRYGDPSKNAHQLEDQMANMFDAAKDALDFVYDGKGKMAFTLLMKRLEQALRRHTILLDHFIRTGQRESRLNHVDHRFVVTALRSGRISELIREMAELTWPREGDDEFTFSTYVQEVASRAGQIIAICPAEVAREVSERTGLARTIDASELPAVDEYYERDDVAYETLAYYLTQIHFTDLRNDEALHRYGMKHRGERDPDTREYRYTWRYYLTAERASTIFSLACLMRAIIDRFEAARKEAEKKGHYIEMSEDDANDVNEYVRLLGLQLEIARLEAVDLYFDVPVAAYIDSLAALTPNLITLLTAAAYFTATQAAVAGQAAAHAQRLETGLAAVRGQAARVEMQELAVMEVEQAIAKRLDAEFERGEFEGKATTAAIHLIPEKLLYRKFDDDKTRRAFIREYGDPLLAKVGSPDDSDYWFDHREVVSVPGVFHDAKAFNVTIYTEINTHVVLLGDPGEKYASVTGIKLALEKARIEARASGRAMKSPLRVVVQPEVAMHDVKRCVGLQMELNRLHRAASVMSNTTRLAQRIPEVTEEIMQCVDKYMPDDTSAEVVLYWKSVLRYATIGASPALAMQEGLLTLVSRATTHEGVQRVLSMLYMAVDPASEYYMQILLLWGLAMGAMAGGLAPPWARGMLGYIRRAGRDMCYCFAKYLGLSLFGVSRFLVSASVGIVGYDTLMTAFSNWERVSWWSGAAARIRAIRYCAMPHAFIGTGWDTCVAQLEQQTVMYDVAMRTAKGAVLPDFVMRLLNALVDQDAPDNAFTQERLVAAVDTVAKVYPVDGDQRPNTRFGDEFVQVLTRIMAERINGRFTTTEVVRKVWGDSVWRTLLRFRAAWKKGKRTTEAPAPSWSFSGALAAMSSVSRFAAIPRILLAVVGRTVGRCGRRAERAGGRSVRAMGSSDMMKRAMVGLVLSNDNQAAEEEIALANKRVLAKMRYDGAVRMGDAAGRRAAFQEMTIASAQANVTNEEADSLRTRTTLDRRVPVEEVKTNMLVRALQTSRSRRAGGSEATTPRSKLRRNLDESDEED